MHIFHRHHEDQAQHANTSFSEPEIYDRVDEKGVRHSGVKEKMTIDNCSLADAFKVVSSIDRYPEFMSVYKSVTILQDNKDPVTGDREQIGDYHLHSAFLDFKYKLRLHIHEENNRVTITWEQVEGPCLANNGRWDLVQQGNAVELTLGMDLSLNFYVPKLLKDWIVSNALHSNLNSMKQRIQAQHSNA